MHGPINVKSPNNTSKWQMGFNSPFKGLSVVEEQEQVATSGTSRPRVEFRITESNALWPSTRVCDFSGIWCYCMCRRVTEIYLQIVCSSLVCLFTRVLTQCVPGLSRDALADIGFLSDQAAAHRDTTKKVNL
jgi:hypothetical protein